MCNVSPTMRRYLQQFKNSLEVFIVSAYVRFLNTKYTVINFFTKQRFR